MLPADIHKKPWRKIMRRITLNIGLLDKDSKMQEVNTLDAYKIVYNIMQKDCTIMQGMGVYTHESGEVVYEPSLQVMMLDFDNSLTVEYIDEKIEALKIALNQESIAFQEEDIKSELK